LLNVGLTRPTLSFRALVGKLPMADRTATADNGYEPLSAERDKLLEAMPPSKRKSAA
jgi:hypothetical protein